MLEVPEVPTKAELSRVLPATAILAKTTVPDQTRPAATRVTRSRPRSRPRLRLAAAAGLALGCGAVAWWTKERADHAYARYLDAAGPRRQSREFSRAERYDRLSGTALLGMEAGLLLTSYWLFY
jgi:hypothetical protein